MKEYDVIIVGSGPAGYAAGIYATRFNLKTLLIGKELGGQVSESYRIENYPGLSMINGMDLATKFKEHAKSLGVETIDFIETTEIKKTVNGFNIKTEGDIGYFGRALIFATGAKKRKLGLSNEDKFRGRGVSYCATCDGAFFIDKIVGVIGGGDSAVASALLLSEYAKKVYLIYRRKKKKMRAMPVWIERAENNKKIEMIFESVPKELKGEENLESVIFDQDGTPIEIKVDGLFVEIGTDPESDLAKKLDVSVNEKGYIRVNEDMSTDVPGIFAAGDVTTGSNMLAQIVTACAEGAIAAESAYKYIKKGGIS
ncbi:MAG: FAD-dependent oxidoreductase [Methanomicrobia archaeon]|nr:FAD-dependent oxidoreductase [Methanomicrobia archaeon]